MVQNVISCLNFILFNFISKYKIKEMDNNSRKLLVFDLDSTLIWSSFKEIPNPDFTIWAGNQCIWVKKRPNLDIFLDYCFLSYDIGVWSAATREYVLKIVNQIFRGRSL